MSSDEEEPYTGYMNPVPPEGYKNYENPEPEEYGYSIPGGSVEEPSKEKTDNQTSTPEPVAPAPAPEPEATLKADNLFDLFGSESKVGNIQPNADSKRRGYNQEFQDIMGMPAKTYGRIIITEHCLPVQARTFQPASLGGIAGGEKYIVNGILFKFAVDNPDYLLYAGDENAMKSASHELNGLMQIQGCGVDGISLPLMCYIDFRGFRLVAVSLLPISSGSLIYGSADAGAHVHADDEILNSKMTKLGQIMNLKEHKVLDKELYGPADIEGHRGVDGRYYLLDFARLCPPEPPTIIDTPHGKRGTQLYRLLRPEFVRRYEKPLCSDAFTAMSTIGFREHAAEVKEAFKKLLEEIIPQTAAKFPTLEGWSDPGLVISTNFVSSALHRAGVNLRHMGRVRSHLLILSQTDPKEINDIIASHLLHEAGARVAKNQLRTLLREKMKATGFPANDPYRTLTVDFLKTLLGDSQQSFRYWNRVFKPKLQNDFPEILQDSENQLDDIRGAVSPRTLVRRLSVLMDLNLDIQDNFTGSDVHQIGAKVTRLPYAEYAEAMVLYYEGKEQIAAGQQQAAARVWKLSKKILQQCLHTRYDFTYVVSLAKVERKLFECGELTMTVEEFEKYLLDLYAEISESVSPLMKVSEKVSANKNSFVDAVLQLQRERVRLCVQCREEFKDSLNVEGCCLHHRAWLVDGKYRCCGEGKNSKGCTPHRHRVRHHNDWPYTAALERISQISNYVDTRQEYLSLEDTSLDSGQSQSLAFGRLLRWRSRTAEIEVPTFYLLTSGYLETYTADDFTEIGKNAPDGQVVLLKRELDGFAVTAHWLCKTNRVIGIKLSIQSRTSAKPSEGVVHFSYDPPEVRHTEILSNGGLDEHTPAEPYKLPEDRVIYTPFPQAPRRRRTDFPSVGLHDLVIKIRSFETSSDHYGTHFKVQACVINRNKEEPILVDNVKLLWRKIGQDYTPIQKIKCNSLTFKIPPYDMQNIEINGTIEFEKDAKSKARQNHWNHCFFAHDSAVRVKLLLETIEGQDASIVIDWVNKEEGAAGKAIPVFDYATWTVNGLTVELQDGKKDNCWKISGFSRGFELDTKLCRRVVYWAQTNQKSEVNLKDADLLNVDMEGVNIWGLVDLNTNLVYAWKISYASEKQTECGGVIYRPVEPYTKNTGTVPIKPAVEEVIPEELLANIKPHEPLGYVDEDNLDDKAVAASYGRVEAHPLIQTLDANMTRLNEGLELILSKLTK